MDAAGGYWAGDDITRASQLYLQLLYFMGVGPGGNDHARRRLLALMMGMPVAFFDKQSTGTLPVSVMPIQNRLPLLHLAR
ncbi:hypothetical protein KCP78_03465 [Salmonella enterica subsp. enterica]|nr:hypothetical protein KCP78_03465 [Salmonella enterica subsp. enterica]